MEIITGRQQSAIKTCIYGPEGIGKTTFASHFPRPVFIDTEGSTRHMDVHRTPRPSSFAMLLEQVRWFRDHPDAYGTLVVDTADWAEQLCAADLCARTKKTGIEDFVYQQFSTNYRGIVNNNAQGRSIFQAAIVGYLLDIQNNQGIQNFEASDVTVEAGEAINAIVVTINIQPVGSVEKIYITISMDA